MGEGWGRRSGNNFEGMREWGGRGRSLWQRFFRRRRGGWGKDQENVERRERGRSL